MTKKLTKWPKNLFQIAENVRSRISEAIEGAGKAEFDKLVDDLGTAFKAPVDPAEALDLLAFHIVTRPILEAFFGGWSNHVSRLMNAATEAIGGLDGGLESLGEFYQKAREEIAAAETENERQEILNHFYNGYFMLANPKEAKRYGIVYTPIEIVDFINESVAEILRREFGCSISDENVKIMDPFTGSGVFITRLIQSGLLGDSLDRKYDKDIHANEITLSASHVAGANIEYACKAAGGQGGPFKGLHWVDTFDDERMGKMEDM
jgi:predicted helicase